MSRPNQWTRRHKWSRVNYKDELSTCAVCGLIRRRGEGPRGGPCWEYQKPRETKWAQYTSGNDPKCKW